MKFALAFAFVCSIAACGSKATPPATTPTEEAPPAMDLSKLGVACGIGDSCDAGTCSKYYGIAGPSGPEFSSCEIACDAGCPTGTECVTIADGPGAVCRVPSVPDTAE